MDYLCLMRPKTGTIISISTSPSGDTMQSSSVMYRPIDPIVVPSYVRIALNLIDRIRKLRASRWGVTYEYIFVEPNGKDLDFLRECCEKGQVKSVVGSRAKFSDIEEVRKICQQVYDGKGGVGKAVIYLAEN
jgi:hypothetical protein